VLQPGEPGFSLDTKRLYVGDGSTAGGNIIGNVNFGRVNPLFGNFTIPGGGAATGLSQTAYYSLCGGAVGDIVYDQASSLLYAITATLGITSPYVNAGCLAPVITPVTSASSEYFLYTSSPQSPSISAFTIKPNSIGISRLTTGIADQTTINGGNGVALNVVNNSIGNGLIAKMAPFTVKVNTASADQVNPVNPQDLVIAPYNFLGRTDAGSPLTSISIQTLGLSLSSLPSASGTFTTPNNRLLLQTNITQYVADDGLTFDTGDIADQTFTGPLTLNTTNSLQYFKYGDFRNNSAAATTTYTADDTTKLNMYLFPWTTQNAVKPAVTFESIALGEYTPQVTLFWMTTGGVSPFTVYYANSGNNTKPYSYWEPNNYITSMYLSANRYLFLGGYFSTMRNSKTGTTTRSHFAVVDLLSGGSPQYTSTTTYGGNTVTNYLGYMGGLYSFGSSGGVGGSLDNLSLNAAPSNVKNWGYGRPWKIQPFNCSGVDFLCIGGEFYTASDRSNATPAAGNLAISTRAKYLLILQKTAGGYISVGEFNMTYNGTSLGSVTDMLSAGKYLYVASRASRIYKDKYTTGSYITMKGVCRIDMSQTAASYGYANAYTYDTMCPQVDTTWTSNAATAITYQGSDPTLLALATYNNVLYVAGNHYVTNAAGKVTNNHITAHYMDSSAGGTPGACVPYFTPIFNNSYVEALAVDQLADGSSPSAVLYIGGDFTTYSPGYGQAATNISRLMAFDISTGTSPTTPTIASWAIGQNANLTWNPNPDRGYIRNIVPLSGRVSDPLYVTSDGFTNICGRPQKYAAAISKAYTTGNQANLLNWPININSGYLQAPTQGSLIAIPQNSTPVTGLSGVLMGSQFTTVNGSYRNRFARVAGYNQIVPPPLSTVGWDLAATAIGNGGQLGVDNTTTIFVTGYPGTQDVINALTYDIYNTVFTLSGNFPSFNRGDLVRFYLRRTGQIGTDDILYQLYGVNGLPSITANDQFSGNAALLGVTVDWNTKGLIPPVSGT
jgi:hypothetical protein